MRVAGNWVLAVEVDLRKRPFTELGKLQEGGAGEEGPGSVVYLRRHRIQPAFPRHCGQQGGV